MTLSVTDHAMQRARQRYGLVHIDKQLVCDDVADALRQGRAGKVRPWAPDRVCAGNAIFAWTRDLNRCYVVEGVRRRAGRSFLRVITAIPGYRGDLHRGDTTWRMVA